MESIRISIIQTDIVWENKQENLRLLHEKLQSLRGITEIVVLPELLGKNSSYYLPVVDMKSTNLDIVLNSYFNKKYSARHTNRSGITITGLLYDLDFNLSPNFGQNLPMQKIVKGNGEAMVLSAYSNSIFKLADELTASVGVNAQFFTLN